MSIKADIDRGLAIIAELEKLETELKAIEVRVKHAALHGEQVELKDADREGKQYRAAGTERIVPVILTADKIIGEFGRDSQRHLQIMDAIENRTGVQQQQQKPHTTTATTTTTTRTTLALAY